MTFSLLWTERKEISTGKGQIRFFRPVKIKKYKRAKPENKEMTDIKKRFCMRRNNGKNATRKLSPLVGKQA